MNARTTALRRVVAGAAALACSFAVFAGNFSITPTIGTITTQNLVQGGAATAGSCVAADISTAGSVQVSTLGTYTVSGGLTAAATNDGATWYVLTGTSTFTRLTTAMATATITSGQQDQYQISGIVTGARQLRVCAGGAVTGSVAITISPAEPAVGNSASSGGGGGGAVTVADGADVAEGATADAAATAGGTGTVSAKLRRISTQIPAAVGATTMSAAMPVTIATDDARIGIITETAPASDTASSGLNGRMQRIAQNLTTLNTSVTASNTQLPTALGQTTAAGSLSVVTASDATSVVAQASTTSGQKGSLIQGAVTTSAPSYTTAQTSPLSLDTTGSLRVNVTAGGSSGATTTSTSDTTRVPVSLMDGVQVTGAISAALPTSSSVTMTSASPGVVGWTSHGRSANEALIWTTGNAVPAPLVAGNTYYVKTVLDANTFTISLTPGGAAINTTSTGVGTQTLTGGVLFTQTMDGYAGVSVATSFTAASYTIQYEQSEDYTYWYGTFGNNPGSTAATQNFISSSTASNNTLFFPKRSKVFRARISAYTSGSMTATATLLSQGSGMTTILPTNVSILAQGANGDTSSSPNNPFMTAVITKTANRTALATDRIAYMPGTTIGVPIVRPWTIPEGEWNYAAAASGISNTTTAVTIKAASGTATVRSYITNWDLMCETLGAATEIAIRDGAGGTVLWRIKISTGGLAPTNFHRALPLKSTLNQLLEVVTLTASVSGACYFNANGFDAP